MNSKFTLPLSHRTKCAACQILTNTTLQCKSMKIHDSPTCWYCVVWIDVHSLFTLLHTWRSYCFLTWSVPN